MATDLVTHYKRECAKLRAIFEEPRGEPVRAFREEGRGLRMIVIHVPHPWDGVEMLRRASKVMELLSAQAQDVHDRGARETMLRVSNVFRAVLKHQ